MMSCELTQPRKVWGFDRIMKKTGLVMTIHNLTEKNLDWFFEQTNNKTIQERFVEECLSQEEIEDFLEKHRDIDYYDLCLYLACYYRERYDEFCETIFQE